MENFESELKSMILKWLRRGYSVLEIRNAMVSADHLLDILPTAKHYLNAIEEGNKVKTEAISHHNV